MTSQLGVADLHRLLQLLNAELKDAGISGELHVIGGAVMCLVYAARPSTQNIDGWFKPARAMREAAARVAVSARVDANWLNDGVKGFLGQRGDFAPFLELSHIRVMVAIPEYLLAMKCLAFRIGAEFHDEDDVRYLLRTLNVTSYAEAVAIVQRYYPLERFPQKTLYALQELLPDAGAILPA
jgi:hypothetical protein